MYAESPGNRVAKERSGIPAHRDQEEVKAHLETWDEKASPVLRGILGLQGQAVHQAKMGPEE